MHYIEVNKYIGCGMKNNDKRFEEAYKKTPLEFIKEHKHDEDVYEIDGKIIVVVECAEQSENIPLNIVEIRIMRDNNKDSRLVYSGRYIAFLQYKTLSGKDVIYYKNDECYPQTFDEFCEDNSDELFTTKELGFNEEDILNQIRGIVHGSYDFNTKIEKEDIIFLKGL